MCFAVRRNSASAEVSQAYTLPITLPSGPKASFRFTSAAVHILVVRPESGDMASLPSLDNMDVATTRDTCVLGRHER